MNQYSLLCNDLWRIREKAGRETRLEIYGSSSSEKLIQTFEKYRYKETLHLLCCCSPLAQPELLDHLVSAPFENLTLLRLRIDFKYVKTRPDFDGFVSILNPLGDYKVTIALDLWSIDNQTYLSQLSAVKNVQMIRFWSPSINVSENKAFMKRLRTGNIKIIEFSFDKTSPDFLKMLSETDSNVLQLRFDHCKGISDSVIEGAVKQTLKNGTLPGGIYFDDKNVTEKILSSIEQKWLVSRYEQKKVFETIDLDARGASNKLKAALVGAGGVGKTSCVRALVGDKFVDEHSSTIGFEVQRIEVNKIDKAWIKEESNGTDLNLLKHILHHQKSYKGENVSESDNLGLDKQKDAILAGDEPSKIDEGISIETLAVNDNNEGKKKLSGEEIKMLAEGVNLIQGNSEYELSLWDFGGQEVFYSLINIFLTENALYLVLFNAHLVANGTPEQVKFQLMQLEFWLSTIQLHAPKSRCIVVGTHVHNLSQKNYQEIDKILAKNIFTTKAHYNITVQNADKIFSPIDSRTGQGIEELRNLMDDELKRMPSLTEEVPLAYLASYDRMINYQSKHRSFLLLEEAEEIIFSTGVKTTTEVFKFLVERGFIVYFRQEELREFVILRPQWLIDGITKVIYDRELHHHYQRKKLSHICLGELKKFETSAIAQRNLLDSIWQISKTTEEQARFFEAVMIFMRLMCRVDRQGSFYVPDLFLTIGNTNKEIEDQGMYTGRIFYIDFSGLYDEAVAEDQNQSYVCFMPTGIFGKIVCEAINYCDEKFPFPARLRAELKFNRARVSLNKRVSILFEVCEDESGKENRIRCLTLGTMTGEDLMLAANSMFEIVDKVKTDFYSNTERQLSLQCLIEVIDPKSGPIRAEYNLIRTKLEEKQWNFSFRPIPDRVSVLRAKDFQSWFDGTDLAQRPALIPSIRFIAPRQKARKEKRPPKDILERVVGENYISDLLYVMLRGFPNNRVQMKEENK